MRSSLYALLFLLLLAACSTDESGSQPEVVRQATVTFMTTPNGLGDNGYNDAAAEGIFAFADETGTRLRLLLPADLQEAEQMYRQWLADNAATDSAVLILGSYAYERMAQEPANPSTRQPADPSTQAPRRVLLFESDAEVEGVATVMVSRYGVSYFAGAMSQGFDVLVFAGAKGVPTIEEAIAGFQEARQRYAGEYQGMPCRTELHYLADGEEGFAMPDSAYRYMDKWESEADEMIFPLLGGSEAGVIRYLNDDEFFTALMVGMDVDQTGLSPRIPFSVVFRVGNVLKQYLTDWLAGRDWPARQRFGMKEGAADIVVTPNFVNHLVLSDERYGQPGTFQRLYEQYKEEAIRKEEQTLSTSSLAGTE